MTTTGIERFISLIIVVFLLIAIPLQYYTEEEDAAIASATRNSIHRVLEAATREGQFSLADLEEIYRALDHTGLRYELQLEIGKRIRLVSSEDEDLYSVMYLPEISREVYEGGQITLDEKDYLYAEFIYTPFLGKLKKVLPTASPDRKLQRVYVTVTE